MATVTDVEVANASFPNVRQDLNDILEALATNFSADAEPNTMYANQFWYETDTNLLKFRNEDNDAWITLAYFDQTNDEWEVRSAVIQAVDSAGVVIKTDDGTTRLTIADSGAVSINTSLDVDNIKIDGNTISSTDTNGNITLDPNGTGDINLSADVDVTGTVTADGLTVEDITTGPVVTINGPQDGTILNLKTNGTDRFSLWVQGTGTDYLSFMKDSANLLRINQNGDISFYEDTGTTPKLTWDASTQRLWAGVVDAWPTTGSQSGENGCRLDEDGSFGSTTNVSACIFLNRNDADGDLIQFFSTGTKEGTISVSGTTVSYNGGHLSRWSQLIGSTKDKSIVKGTVLSNLDEMCEWKRVEFDYQHLVSETIEAQDEVLDEEGNVVQEAVEAQDAVYETRTTSESYDGDANVGDVIGWEYQGQTVQATVIFEDNEQLNRMKVSDVEGDPNVAGVFVNWDDDDDVNTADMNIAMTGDMVIRIAKGVTVERGDLLMSAGDGTAKPQDDDIVRSKTIAKVTSTHVSHTYDDGSYLVPCVLMAC